VAACTRGPRAKKLREERVDHRYRRRHSGLPCAVVLRLTSRSCVRKICQNVRTGGSDQPPVAGSEPVRAQRPLSLSGSEGQIRCLPQPEQLHGLRARTEQGREWMMAQNEVVVVGIDVAKDKVDACIRSLSQRQTFPSTAEGRRALIRWLRKHKVGKAAMEASGGYERDWTPQISLKVLAKIDFTRNGFSGALRRASARSGSKTDLPDDQRASRGARLCTHDQVPLGLQRAVQKADVLMSTRWAQIRTSGLMAQAL
jgi:hypothetical protein